MELFPPRISNPALFALIADILSIQGQATDNAKLRLRLMEVGSWQKLFELAAEQGVWAPLIWALQQRSLLLPVPKGHSAASRSPHPTTQILSYEQEYLHRRGRQREQLIMLIGALNSVNIVPFLIKGSRYLFGPPGSWSDARDMRDIDILVRPEDADRAVNALAANGYRADSQFIPLDHHLPEMWHSEYPSAVEIHTEALQFSARDILKTDEVWCRGMRASKPQGSVFVMPREWHLLHGLLHHQISDRGHVRRILSVNALWEFARLGNELSDEEWQTIASHLAARGHADVIESWIALAARLYGLKCPNGVDISASARAHADATFAFARAPSWWRRARLLADQFRFGFAPRTLSARYRSETAVPATVVRHVRFLMRRYRGRLWRRLFGGG